MIYWFRFLPGVSSEIIVTSSPVDSLAALGNGMLASGDELSSIRIWNVTTQIVSKTLKTNDRIVLSLLELAPDKLISGDSGELRVWNLETGSYQKLGGSRYFVACLGILLTGKLLLKFIPTFLF